MDLNILIWVGVFSISAMTVSGLGILAMSNYESWAKNNKEHFMCFAAGMLITSALITAFPHALEHSKFAGLAALAGFLFMYISNKLVKSLSKSKLLAFSTTALIGIGIHSMMDGIIYSVTFSTSITAGVLAGVGLVAHEFAEGVVTFSMLSDSGMKKKKALMIAFFVAALTTPIGALVSLPLVQAWSEGMTGLALGFVVGVLIYTSASHLLPEVENGNNKHSHFSLVLGIGLAVILSFIGH